MSEPLHIMRRTGRAVLDVDGAMVESGEYVAALYESAHADDNYPSYRGDGATPEQIKSHSDYAETAYRLAEELRERDIHDVTNVA